MTPHRTDNTSRIKNRQQNIRINTRLVGLSPASVHVRPAHINRNKTRQQSSSLPTTTTATSLTRTLPSIIVNSEAFVPESHELVKPVKTVRLLETPELIKFFNSTQSIHVISDSAITPNPATTTLPTHAVTKILVPLPRKGVGGAQQNIIEDSARLAPHEVIEYTCSKTVSSKNLVHWAVAFTTAQLSLTSVKTVQ